MCIYFVLKWSVDFWKKSFLIDFLKKGENWKKILPVGELNPGLPRDRRGYLPLY